MSFVANGHVYCQISTADAQALFTSPVATYTPPGETDEFIACSNYQGWSLHLKDCDQVRDAGWRITEPHISVTIWWVCDCLGEAEIPL